MRILILGGSNAGIRDGWAKQFAALASAHQIENRFLGAVGSLYGLLALMKAQREKAPSPDVVIFEYCLNDISLFQATVLNIRLLADTLDAVADFCAADRVSLVFLNLHPLAGGDRFETKAREKISKIYRSVAARRNVPALWLCDALGGPADGADYRDQNHFSVEASGRIARALKIMLDAGPPAGISQRSNATGFTYTDASQAQVEGPVSSRVIKAGVFEGDFLEISRGGRSFWPGQGYVAGIMLQTNDMSGDYAVRVDKETVRKRAFSQMQAAVPNLMLLHYVKKPLWTREAVEISMPDREADLLGLPADRGIVEGAPTETFQNQTLRIHAVIFWAHRPARWKVKQYLSASPDGSQRLRIFRRSLNPRVRKIRFGSAFVFRLSEPSAGWHKSVAFPKRLSLRLQPFFRSLLVRLRGARDHSYTIPKLRAFLRDRAGFIFWRGKRLRTRCKTP